VPIRFQVIQEVGEEPGVQVGKRHPVGRQWQLLLGKAQQQYGKR